MYNNRVKETTTTTGTGNLTTAGAVTNFITFNSGFGTNKRFYYWIVDDTNNVWECGIGYLSASTTLVRDIVLDNSSGGTSALNLSAGTKTIFCAPVAGTLISGADINHASTVINNSFHSLTVNATPALTTNRMYYIPYFNTITKTQSTIGCIVTTLKASSIAYMGIYDVKDGKPANKLSSGSSSVSVATTGVKTVSLTTAQKLAVGWYFVGIVSDSNPNMRGCGASAGYTCSFLGADSTSSQYNYLYEDITGYSDVPSTPGTLTLATGAVASVGLLV